MVSERLVLSTATAADYGHQLSLFEAAPAPAESDLIVRRTSRARRLSITVHPSGRVEVLAPKRVSDRAVSSFVAEHASWIHTTQIDFRARYGPTERSLPRAIELAALNERVIVHYERCDGDFVRSRQSRDRLVLRGDVGADAECRKVLKRWLAKLARDRLGPSLARLAAVTGLGYQRLQIRSQRTCWGSHSSSGTISLNYCLLFLRPELVRYLLIHELSHSRHMNHSRRFWALVERHEPDYKKLDAELGAAWSEIPGWLDLY